MTAPAFSLRFKDPDTKEMLRLVSEQLGVPMNDVAENAIRNELILLGAAIEQQLTEIVEALRSYDPERDLDRYIEAFGAGEALGEPLQATRVEGRTNVKLPARGGRTGKATKVEVKSRKQQVERASQLADALASFKKK